MRRIYLQHTSVSPSKSVQEIIEEITMRGATQSARLRRTNASRSLFNRVNGCSFRSNSCQGRR
jgi:hypothetical protein